ncbi:MAG TPA: hypothetical protein PKC69_03020 [Chitinophagaceae bacterium]|nr:hypothetical protein [Chitinophagaceae bacterium]
MKKSCLIFTLLFIAGSLRAQHCPFDGAGLLVVSVRGADSTGFNAEYIMISVRDVYGQIVNVGGKPLVFVQNPRKTLVERRTYDHNSIAYGFAGDDFILAFPTWLMEEYREDGGLYIYANPVTGRLMPAVHKIKPGDIYNIHYLNGYLSGQPRTEPVPENSNEPFRHRVRLTLPGPDE